MKISKIVFIAAITTLLTNTAIANDDTNPACAMVICLSATGGGEACQDAKDQFFDIVVKKHGKIKIGRTIAKRKDKLNSCDGAETSDVERIIARYGAIIK